MKNFLTAVLICFCFVSVSFAGDAKLTPEQGLTIQIEKLQNTVDYTRARMETLAEQHQIFATVGNQAEREKVRAEGQLKALKKGAKKK